MGVFLRWGIFGILAVAALVYAYNALGHLADRRRPVPASVIAPPNPAPAPAEPAPSGPGPRAAADGIPAKCRVELDIARRAAASRSIGEPLDRLLRIQEIAWEKDERRRARLTEVATRWFGEPTPVDLARLDREVVAACVKAGS